MERSSRRGACGFFLVSAGLLAVSVVLAADDKEIRDKAVKLGEALEKKDAATADKLIADLVKADAADPEVLMNLLAKRNDKGTGGLGIGAKAGDVKPDHIDKKFDEMSKKQLTKKELESQGEALAKAAYTTAGVMAVFAKKCPKKTKAGNQDPKEWEAWSQECNKGSIELAEALKAKDAKATQKAAEKVYNACSACHSVWK